MGSLEYFKKKGEELNLIALSSEISNLRIPTPYSYDEVVLSKEKLRIKIKELVLERSQTFQESQQKSKTSIKLFEKWSFNWTYQRYDGQFDKKEVGNLAYWNEIPKEFVDYGLFVRSGMSAITTTLLSLDRLDGINIHIDESIYFETLQFMKTQLSRVEVKNNNKIDFSKKSVLLVDSISQKPLSEYISKFRMDQFVAIVVDTTCWLANDHELQELFRISLEEKLPIILLRSHLKLDFFGIEFGKLGSMVFCIPKQILPSRYEWIIKIMTESFSVAGSLGVLADLDNIFPALGDPRLYSLHKERILRIRRTNSYISEALSEKIQIAKISHVLIVLPPHNMFFLIKPFQVEDIINDEVVDLSIQKMINSMKTMGLPAGDNPSFGLEYSTFNHFKDSLSRKPTIRVALSDIHEQEFHRVITAIFKSITENL